MAVQYEIFLVATMRDIAGKIHKYHLYRSEYEDLKNALRLGFMRWHMLRKDDNGNYTVNVWVMLSNMVEVSFAKELYEDGVKVKTAVADD